MRNSSGNHEVIDIKNLYSLRLQTKEGIPLDCLPLYARSLNLMIKQQDKLIDSIFECYPDQLSFPLDLEPFENYFDGFNFTYIELDSSCPSEIHGLWRMEDREVTAYYASWHPEVRQRFTIMHELFHFVQSIDPWFLDFVDALIEYSGLPQDVICKLVDRVADKGAVQYLTPNFFISSVASLLSGILVNDKVSFGLKHQNNLLNPLSLRIFFEH